MKKIETHIYIVLAIFLSTFIVGSFFDYTISQSVFARNDTFGLVVSTIGTVPGYGVLAFIGGGFAYLGFKGHYEKTWMKICLFIAALAAVGSAIFFSGREFFGPNGWYWIGVKRFWGYFIVLLPQACFGFLGYLFAGKTENNNLWLIYAILIVAFILANVLGTTLLKGIFHRPRFRSLDEYNGIYFHNWYEPCNNYKELQTLNHLDKDEFKSFPSGHASVTACIMMFASFLPNINKKFEKYTIPSFYIGLAWCLLISFCRIRVGAHFLSDVSMGALLSIIFFLIAKIVMSNLKILKNTEPQSQDDEVASA